MRFRIRHLQHVLRVNQADDMVEAAFKYRNAGKWPHSQQFDELFNRVSDGNRHHLRARLHRFAHRFFAELHHRLNQVAIALIENSLFLASLDQSVHRFRLRLGLRFGMLSGQ